MERFHTIELKDCTVEVDTNKATYCFDYSSNEHAVAAIALWSRLSLPDLDDYIQVMENFKHVPKDEWETYQGD